MECWNYDPDGWRLLISCCEGWLTAVLMVPHIHSTHPLQVPVMDMSVASELVQRAAASRSCEATAMNSVSSRSHSVFMLYIAGIHPPSGTQLQGCLCLVDLAGR